MQTFKTFFLSEGGNVFSITGTIKQADVIPTVKHLEEITGLSLVDNMLGTTGKAAESGDIDLVIDSRNVSKSDLEKKLQSYWKRHSVDTTGTSKSGISLHFLSPVWNSKGEQTGKYVQVDFMFHEDPMYLRWFYAANEKQPYKGKDRNILLSAIAKNTKNKTYSGGLSISTHGLKDRQSGNIITREPDAIAKLLFGKKASASDLNNIQSILAKLVDIYGHEKAKIIVKDAEETTTHKFL